MEEVVTFDNMLSVIGGIIAECITENYTREKTEVDLFLENLYKKNEEDFWKEEKESKVKLK